MSAFELFQMGAVEFVGGAEREPDAVQTQRIVAAHLFKVMMRRAAVAEVIFAVDLEPPDRRARRHYLAVVLRAQPDSARAGIGAATRAASGNVTLFSRFERGADDLFATALGDEDPGHPSGRLFSRCRRRPRMRSGSRSCRPWICHSIFQRRFSAACAALAASMPQVIRPAMAEVMRAFRFFLIVGFSQSSWLVPESYRPVPYDHRPAGTAEVSPFASPRGTGQGRWFTR